MDTTRKKDEIAGTIDTAERVRKLEVMSNPRTLIPRQWRPEKDETEAIVEATCMIGCLDSRSYQETADFSLPVEVGPIAQYLYSRLMTEGFGTSVDLAKDWTVYLQLLKMLPNPAIYDKLLVDNVSPTGVPSQIVLTGRYNIGSKILYYTGSPAGFSYSFWSQGDFLPGIGYIPDMGSLLSIYTQPPPASPDYAIPPGACLLSPSNGIVSRNNKWSPFSGPNGPYDCEGPYEPRYTSAQYPGNPVAIYDSGPDPCPSDGLGLLHSGSIFRMQVGLPPTSHYLSDVPRFLNGNDPLGNDDASKVDWNGIYFNNKASWTLSVVQALNLCPLVSAWFSDHLPGAVAWARGRTHANWQAFKLMYPWSGNVEAQVAHGRVILRGQCTWEESSFSNTPPMFRYPKKGLPLAPTDQASVPAKVFMAQITNKNGVTTPCQIRLSGIGTSQAINYFYLYTAPSSPDGPWTINLDGASFRYPLEWGEAGMTYA